MEEHLNPRRRRWPWIGAGIVMLLVDTFFAVHLEQFFDATESGAAVSAETRRMHDAAIVTDLNADTMLGGNVSRVWAEHGRIVAERSAAGTATSKRDKGGAL